MKTQFLKPATILLLSLSLGLIVTSCDKTNEVETVSMTTEVEDENYTSEVYDEIDEIGDEALDLAESNEITLKSGIAFNYNRLSECVTVTRVISNDTVLTTIDFGETNCLCNDGRERRGKILMTHYGSYWDGATSLTFTFDNYFVDDNQVLGEKIVSQQINSNGFRESNIQVTGSVILADGTGTISWEAERTRIIVEGSNTRNKRDDVIEITGGSSCTLTDGTVVTSTILTPLVRKNEVGCFLYFVQGTRQTIVGDETPVTIDFGDGECDNLAEITKDGVTTTIELKRKRPNFL